MPTEGFSAKGLELKRSWDDNVCRSTLSNRGKETVRVNEIVLVRVAHDYPPETGYYGEGFTMLSQTGGTLGAPVNIGGLTDRNHYKIPQPADALTAYGMFTLFPAQGDVVTLAKGVNPCKGG